MKFFKLTRTQKIVRNFLLIAICLFLLEWMLEFPCLTKQGLLNRAEREYLLNGPTELILDREDYFERKVLFGRNKDGILAVDYDVTPLGFRYSLWDSTFFPDSDYVLVQDMDVWFNRWAKHVYYAVLVGLPERVARAELELKKDERSLFCFEGVWQEPEVMVFPSAEGDEAWETALKWNKILLRLYDGEGNLLQEHSYDQLAYGGNGGGRIP